MYVIDYCCLSIPIAYILCPDFWKECYLKFKCLVVLIQKRTDFSSFVIEPIFYKVTY